MSDRDRQQAGSVRRPALGLVRTLEPAMTQALGIGCTATRARRRHRNHQRRHDARSGWSSVTRRMPASKLLQAIEALDRLRESDRLFLVGNLLGRMMPPELHSLASRLDAEVACWNLRPGTPKRYGFARAMSSGFSAGSARDRSPHDSCERLALQPTTSFAVGGVEPASVLGPARLPPMESEAVAIARDGIWSCHACGVGGDALTWIAKCEHLDLRSDFPGARDCVDDRRGLLGIPSPSTGRRTLSIAIVPRTTPLSSGLVSVDAIASLKRG